MSEPLTIIQFDRQRRVYVALAHTGKAYYIPNQVHDDLLARARDQGTPVADALTTEAAGIMSAIEWKRRRESETR